MPWPHRIPLLVTAPGLDSLDKEGVKNQNTCRSDTHSFFQIKLRICRLPLTENALKFKIRVSLIPTLSLISPSSPIKS